MEGALKVIGYGATKAALERAAFSNSELQFRYVGEVAKNTQTWMQFEAQARLSLRRSDLRRRFKRTWQSKKAPRLWRGAFYQQGSMFKNSQILGA